MDKRIVIAIIIFVFSLNVFADTKKELLAAIPFATYQSAPATTFNQVPQNFNPTLIPAAEVESLVVRMRAAVCKSVGSGSIRIWITAGANGKVVAVSAFAQTGLEITIHCAENKKIR
jgi:hypothetical protein